jgi:hypothetical protein
MPCSDTDAACAHSGGREPKSRCSRPESFSPQWDTNLRSPRLRSCCANRRQDGTAARSDSPGSCACTHPVVRQQSSSVARITGETGAKEVWPSDRRVLTRPRLRASNFGRPRDPGQTPDRACHNVRNEHFEHVGPFERPAPLLIAHNRAPEPARTLGVALQASNRGQSPSDVDVDVDGAARAWADAVDEEARSGRG